jgi:hypothetical protein
LSFSYVGVAVRDGKNERERTSTTRGCRRGGSPCRNCMLAFASNNGCCGLCAVHATAGTSAPTARSVPKANWIEDKEWRKERFI